MERSTNHFSRIFALRNLFLIGLIAVAGTMPEAPAQKAPETPAVCTFSEGFEFVAFLLSKGWYMQNKSQPLGATVWFQGNPSVFVAHAGDSGSYAGANY